jgi:hypothetical protein
VFGENWTATYYNSTDLSGPVVYTELMPKGINVNWGVGSPNPAVRPDNFSARFTSVQLFDAGIYEFVVSSDAGVRVFIDERVVLDQFYVRTLTTDRFRVRMEAGGVYPLKVEYFASVGQAAVQFMWWKADVQHQLEQSTIVANLWPQLTSDWVKRAIVDAETLLQTSGATSALDRMHTALHGYLRLACDRANIAYEKDDTITRLLNILQKEHSVFQTADAQKEQTRKILKAFATISDALNTLRNHASLAHANQDLLEPAEAMLAINAARSILNYLDAKFSQPKDSTIN